MLTRCKNHCETRKSVKICYLFNVSQEQVRRSWTSTNWNDASTAREPLCVTRLLNVLMASGIRVYALAFVLERTLKFKLFPFPVNLGPTRAYDSAMGGNASTGLGSADRHSLRDMKSMEADDRPTEDTNRNSEVTLSGDQNHSCSARSFRK